MDEWEKLWHEAKVHAEVAGEQFSAGRPSVTIQHAFEACELAAKAMRQAPLTYADMQAAGSYGALEGYTYGQFQHGLEPVGGRDGHNFRKILDAPWLQGPDRDALIGDWSAVTSALGVKDVYQAARYPDQWDNRPPPSQSISAHHAQSALNIMQQYLAECDRRFRSR